MKKFFDRLLGIYQDFLSPGRNGLLKMLYPFQCRYTPSCSDYARQAIKKHGVIKGSLKGLWRIIRCNPWSKGGVDIV